MDLFPPPRGEECRTFACTGHAKTCGVFHLGHQLIYNYSSSSNTQTGSQTNPQHFKRCCCEKALNIYKIVEDDPSIAILWNQLQMYKALAILSSLGQGRANSLLHC